MENLFVELIQLSLGNRNSLSQTPSTADWERLYLLANKQTIVGICLYGLQKLPDEQSINLSQALKLGWIALTIQIQKNNDIANQRCLELQNKLNDDGFRGLILKGQGVAALYPAEIKQYRQSGDIDVWVDGTREQVIEYAVGIKPSYEFDEKHVHFDCFTDIPVELHWIPVSKWNPKWNRLLKQYFENERERQFSQSCEGPRFPTADFQLTHQLLHVLGHYLSGGVYDLYGGRGACGIRTCHQDQHGRSERRLRLRHSIRLKLVGKRKGEHGRLCRRLAERRYTDVVQRLEGRHDKRAYSRAKRDL